MYKDIEKISISAIIGDMNSKFCQKSMNKYYSFMRLIRERIGDKYGEKNYKKRQIIYADQCNKNYDDTNTLKYYEIIGEGDSQYAPYANLACARIHNDLGHYNRALGFYKKQLSVMI